jgi:glycosyl transferase family 25
MHVHVINLDRSVARLDEFRRWNAHVPDIERFAATDGATVNRQQLIERNIIAEDLRYTDAALGCALSHLFFWQMASTKSAVTTVCEDDAILHGSFSDIAPRLVDTLPKDWDIVVWGWNFDSILSFDLMPGIAPCLATFDQERLRNMVRAFQSQPLSPQLFRLFRAFGTVCYSISAAGSRKLLERAVPLRNFTLEVRRIKTPALPNVGIDVVMNEAYSNLNAFVSFPPLAVTKNDHSVSTIRGSLPGNQQ